MWDLLPLFLLVKVVVFTSGGVAVSTSSWVASAFAKTASAVCIGVSKTSGFVEDGYGAGAGAGSAGIIGQNLGGSLVVKLV